MDALVTQSELTIRAGSTSFAMAARLLDRATRDDAVMLYAWCRYCDDMIDDQVLGHGREVAVDAARGRRGPAERLARLRRATDEALAGRSSCPIFEALRRVLNRHRIPACHPHALLDGFAMDIRGRVYDDISDTLDYCYHVAGVVGVMMAMIMGAREPRALDRASDLGIAFQLTNIARDVIDDARAKRVYLPRTVLERHGIERVDPDDGAQRRALHAATLELLDVADRYYASSLAGLACLPPRSAWAIAAARRIYAAIGRCLRERGPEAWDTRIVSGDAVKVLLLAVALGDVVRSRASRAVAPRTGLLERPR